MGVLFTTAAGTAVKLSTIASIAGAGIAAAGAIGQGKAAQNTAKFNAEMLRSQGERQRQIAELNASRKRKDNAALEAKQRAIMAGSGRDASSGSALLLQEDLAEEGEFNARLIENQAEADISNTNARRTLALSEGRNARTASYIRAGSTLLNAGQSFV
jgi:hypothetical protein